MISGIVKGKGSTKSLSPKIHALIGNYEYKDFFLESSELKSFLQEKKFDFVNVTIPHKEKCLDYLDEISPLAKTIGAVNTIVNNNGKLIGYNTDYYGFIGLLEKNNICVENKTVLLLGFGGAGKAIYKALIDLDAKPIICKRKGEINYLNVENFADKVEIIINATPVGQYDNEDGLLIDLGKFKRVNCVIDVVYKPLKTSLLIKAESLGIKAVNGLSMLVIQAVKSSELAGKTVFSKELIENIYNKILSEKQNIILIGLAGVGKTSIGKVLATKLGKDFIDTDELFTKSFNITPSKFIEEKGEIEFRKKESEVISSLDRVENKVIATGGGAVLLEENRKLLKQNGRVFYIKRDLDKIDSKNRPLYLKYGVAKLNETREPIYTAFCNDTVINNGSIDSAVNEIESKLGKVK